MSIKSIVASVLVISATLVAAPSNARGICGIGKVIEVREGFNSGEDLLVRLESSAYNVITAAGLDSTIVVGRFVRFKASSLTSDRLQSIRALAYLALVSGKSIYAYTHSDDVSSQEGGCGDATELSVFNDGVEPRLPGQFQEPL